MIPFNHLGWLFNRFGNAAYPAAIVTELCDALQSLPVGATLLDLGAGTGTVGNYAFRCRRDLRLVASDPADGMLRYVPAHVEKVVAKAEALPFADHTFDAVTVGEALHHFEEPNRALGELARVLRPDGVVFIYEFDPSAFLGRFICRAEKLFGEPGHFYPPATLCAMLEAHGFTVDASRHGWRYTLRAVRNR